MYSLQSNPALPFNPSDFGFKFVGSTLQAPPKVASILHRLGVRGPEFIIPMMDSMPSAFTGPLGLSRSDYLCARNVIARLLEMEGVAPSSGQPDVELAFGAVPPF